MTKEQREVINRAIGFLKAIESAENNIFAVGSGQMANMLIKMVDEDKVENIEIGYRLREGNGEKECEE